MLARTFVAHTGPGAGGRIVLGIYGGICSGKSLTCDVLRGCGAAVIDVDKVAHAAYAPGTACNDDVVRAFGAGVRNATTGEIDRPVLGKVVFEDPSGARLAELNRIVWPRVQEITAERVAALQATHEVVAVEAALMMEAGWHTTCSHLWMFYVRPEVAVQRLTSSRGLSVSEAEARLGKQLGNAERAALVEQHFDGSRRWVCDRSDLTVEAATTAIQEAYTRLTGAAGA